MKAIERKIEPGLKPYRTAAECIEGQSPAPASSSTADRRSTPRRAGSTKSSTTWRPSIRMPRWARRIALEVTEVRIERPQAISEADCIAEGTPGGPGAIPGYGYHATPGEPYRWLWKQINGPGNWDANPWLRVVKFRRVAP
ncbi:hypothetical protein [Rhizobacter sp. Root1221]|uniref:hypothetical protein n=1 Tax=Rhizobacter sp. Root1221 TaxID=1736433 RepID=UPI0006F92360|nr:hypothetical protein [Rhizobacter sp. Root1221]KQW02796.1 hypothetical protein ASC87_00085 [Rhizobacter sp. Root1221]